jgi:hypothetical protein
LENRELISTLKNLYGRKDSMEQITQFSLGNNVLNAPASNADDFLSKDASVFQLS